MKEAHRLRRLLLGVLVAVFLVAAACGSDGDDDAAETESGQEASDGDEAESDDGEDEGGDVDESELSADEIAEGQASGTLGLVSSTNDMRGEGGPPVPGGELVVDWPSDIDSLDPITSSSFQTHSRIGPVYETLFTFDTGPEIGATQQILIPRLATGMEISDDGLTYTISLRDDVVWQNVEPTNGRPFTSDDVVATFEAIKAEGFQSYMLERVETITAPDDYTVVLELSGPFAPLENFLANHHMWILPREAFEGGYDRTQTAVGTGPFIMTEREVDVETVYEKNPDYWKTDPDNGDAQLPYLDGMRIVVIADTQAAAAAFRAGETDISWTSLSPQERELMMEQYPEAQYFSWLDAGMGQVGLNQTSEIFQDPNVRRAVSLAIDRDGMGETIRGGGTIPGPVAPALADYSLSEEERREYLYYDPEEAQQLLADAGYADGLDVTLIATTGYGATYSRQTEWLIEDLTNAGFNVTYDELDYTTYFSSRWPDLEYDIQFGPQTPFLEPDEWLRAQFYSSGARNWYGVNDPDLDAMLEEQLTLVDRDERIAKIKEIQTYILENTIAPIPVWTYLSNYQYQPWVRNYYRHASYGILGIEYAWLDQ
ncbi:MAG: ABC transporter substrate-binding protein [Actinomycetota bacterium]|nr:ABC transporter substrate-binding protein [Actinomycetota bacterium]